MRPEKKRSAWTAPKLQRLDTADAMSGTISGEGQSGKGPGVPVS